MDQPETPIECWADRIEQTLSQCANLSVSRAVVLAETASTQDAAAQFDLKKQGIVCVAGRQSRGRGRLARVWADDFGLGVSMTIGLARRESDGHLALGIGVAVADAVASFGCEDRIGLRWPNDVVDRPTGKKISGTLIEHADGFNWIGIGINVHQQQAHWDTAGQHRAISLAQLGADVDRLTLIERVLRRIDTRLGDPVGRIVADWLRSETLVGSARTFHHNGQRVSGVVESIDPTSELVVRTQAGVVRLPAATTSLVHDA